MSNIPNTPDSIDRDLEVQEVPAKVRARTYITATLAVLLTLEIAAIGIYAYVRISSALKPENLANQIEQSVRENYPEFRQELVSQAHEKAPEIAQRVSKSILAAASDARADLERIAARQLAAGLDTGTELSAEQFRKLLRDNHAQFVKVFESIEDAPEEAHRLVLETEANIEKELSVDLQRQAKLAVSKMSDFNAKLDRLAGPPETLSAKEQLERRIVRVLRAMQQSDADVQISSLTQPRR